MPYGEENLVDQHLSTIGLPLLVNSMEEFKRQHPSSKLDLAGIVFNATTDYSPEEMTAKSEVRALAEKNGWHVFTNEVSYSRSYARGAREGSPIFRTWRSQRKRKKQFAALAEEFAKRIGL